LTGARRRAYIHGMTSETAKILADYLLGNLRHEFNVSRKVIAAVPTDQSAYKPSEKCMSGIQLAAHLATAEAFFLNGILNGAFTGGEDVPLKTTEEILAWYDANIPALYDKVAAMSGEKLAAPINFMNFMNEPAVIYLGLNLKHSIHHRGQLSSYLRPMGSKVPGIYGPSGDEPIKAAGV
jgi:uncharacterized damage-inducible protein DinB